MKLINPKTHWPENLLPLRNNQHETWQEQTKNYLFNYAKMADQIRNKGDIINNLTKIEKEDRWNAIIENNYSDFNDSNKKLLQTNDKSNSFEIPIFLHYYENNNLNSKFIFYPSDYKIMELFDDLPKIFDGGLQFDNLISQVQELLKP